MVGVPLVLEEWRKPAHSIELKKELDQYQHLEDCYNQLSHVESWLMTDSGLT